MALPWLTVGKLVLDNIDTIVGVVKPAFTRKKVESPSQTDLLNQQIAELQSASSSNAEQIKELAAQLKQVVTALEQAALEAAAERARVRRLSLAAIALSAMALVAAIVSISTAHAAVGVVQLAGKDGDGPVTVFYPSSSEERPLKRGPFDFRFADGGAPVRGNGRLVVVSHGSGGSAWVHANLARTLVEAGFVVAAPEHRGDNYRDPSTPGPESWKRRPAEVSRAIDAVAGDARFAPLLSLDKVGMYGMSAGGHTALTLAGGRWSPALFARHCDAHIGEDFQGCVGLALRLNGNFLDGMKKTLALLVIDYRLKDATLYSYNEPRIAAVVAAVPLASDFDPASLAVPRVPLALVAARQDKWLPPRFHSDAVLKVCASCEPLAEVAAGGHGALLSPLPPGMTGLIGDLLNDPPGFDRASLAEVDRKITAFFQKHLR